MALSPVNVAVFWDLASCAGIHFGHTETDYAAFGNDIVNFVSESVFADRKGSLSFTGFYDASKLCVDHHTVLRNLGYELVSTSLSSAFFGVGAHILLWLWSKERLRENLTDPTIVIVSSDETILPMLKMLRLQNVTVVLVTDLVNTKWYHECMLVSNMLVDIQKNYSKPRTIGSKSYLSGNIIHNFIEVPPQPENDQGKIPLTNGTIRNLWDVSRGSGSGETSRRSSQLHSSDWDEGDYYQADGTRKLDLSGPLNPNESGRLSYNSLATRRSGPLSKPEPWSYPPEEYASSMNRAINIPSASPQWSTQQKIPPGMNDYNLDAQWNSLMDSTTTMSGLTYGSAPPLQQQPNLLESLHGEHRALLEELVAGFRSLDVQSTVSTLRKIYTKQYRDFRIPVALKFVCPGAEYPTPGSGTSPTAVVFSFNCIQWCMGGQKNCNTASFKYKMNKKISHWLLNEQVRKGIPLIPVDDIIYAAVAAASNILNQVVELDLALEILNAGKVENPAAVLQPFVDAWKSSPDPASAERARLFSCNRPSDYHAIESMTSMLQDGMGWLDDGSSGVSDFIVSQRLLSLLNQHPNGILGSRIPILYRDRYNEPLRLRGMKLKDMLRALDGVEIVGKDGPGDKIFRRTLSAPV